MIMQSAKRRKDSDDKCSFTLSFRFSKDLVSKIVGRWEEEGFANRTALVEAACNLYFDTFPCPRCGNRNHINSMYCSICGCAFTPSYELKKELKRIYDDFLERQEEVLSHELEVMASRDRCNANIESLKPCEEISDNVEEIQSIISDILEAVPEKYWLRLTLQTLEKDGLEEVCKLVPSDCRTYAYNVNEVRNFFESSTYLKDSPILTRDKYQEIISLIEDMNDYLTQYDIMLKRNAYLCLKVYNLIDKFSDK